MVAPTIYRSDDASAPVLSGEVDKLRLLLKACLVDGYGAKPAAGWTMPYSATNYGIFRQGGGLQHYLWVNDSNSQMSRCVGYTAATGILDFTGPFPTEIAFPAGYYLRKSTTAAATARPWILLATDTTFYLTVYGGNTVFTANGGESNLGFGQLESFLSGDTKHSFIMAGTDSSTSSTSPTTNRQVFAGLGSAITGHAIASAYTQAGGGVAFFKRAQNNLFQQTASSNGGVAYPDPVSGGLLIEQMIAQDTTTHVRGVVPGMWSLGHVTATGFASFDTFQGNGVLAGKQFLLLIIGSYAIAFETNGGW